MKVQWTMKTDAPTDLREMGLVLQVVDEASKGAASIKFDRVPHDRDSLLDSYVLIARWEEER